MDRLYRVAFGIGPLALALLAGCRQEVAKPPPPAPQEVLYVTPTQGMVTEYEEFTGRTAAVEVVELRSRVSGYLNKVLFDDGAHIDAGTVLFEVDDRAFAAEEARTAAMVKQLEARVNRLTRQQKRAEELFRKQAMSQDEYETIAFDLAEAEATTSAAKAQHDIAKLNLEFTKVKAPLSGRIGLRRVDEGNLVTADVTLLATIIPLDKVYVYFDMDERTVLKLRRLEHGGMTEPAAESSVVIDIALADSDEFVLRGKIDFIDNQVDPATGTLRVRATVDNSNLLLSPGLFVRLRYPIGVPAEQWLVPEESLASDQGRPFVYVIVKEQAVVNGETKWVDKIASRRIEIGPQVGAMRVVRSGLQAADNIAVTGLQRIRQGVVVTPKPRPVDLAPPGASSGSLAAEKQAGGAQPATVTMQDAAK